MLLIWSSKPFTYAIFYSRLQGHRNGQTVRKGKMQTVKSIKQKIKKKTLWFESKHVYPSLTEHYFIAFMLNLSLFLNVSQKSGGATSLPLSLLHLQWLCINMELLEL